MISIKVTLFTYIGFHILVSDAHVPGPDPQCTDADTLGHHREEDHHIGDEDQFRQNEIPEVKTFLYMVLISTSTDQNCRRMNEKGSQGPHAVQKDQELHDGAESVLREDPLEAQKRTCAKKGVQADHHKVLKSRHFRITAEAHQGNPHLTKKGSVVKSNVSEMLTCL